ncbi:protein TIFY 5A-like [Lycium barbarum]|uniref:protein TIFY 5A-like n=1 Tax=Lycium barbarum TaxID=112863 RepID=UPI00293EC962|nr:protein TIFY 5A-like [Lycium barbarum]
MGMKRKPRLSLQLFPLLASSSSSSSSSSASELCTDQSLNKEITILCNTQAGVSCDTSELQALAILWHARREMEEKYSISGSNSRTPYLQFQLHSPYGLSLRKSLQRFLQKRRGRIQTATPY